jgi:hypothetical protein
MREALALSCSARSAPGALCSGSAKSRTITRNVRFGVSCRPPVDIAGESENEESMAESDAFMAVTGRSSAPTAKTMIFRQPTKEKKTVGFKKFCAN